MVVIEDVRSGERQTVSEDGQIGVDPLWSPDGAAVAFQQASPLEGNGEECNHLMPERTDVVLVDPRDLVREVPLNTELTLIDWVRRAPA
jgi:hypothetical protein